MTQTASETSASQSSLLKQLSSLESGAGLCCCGFLCSFDRSNTLSDKLVGAALHDVRSSLPDAEFVTQLERLKALQLRIQAVFDRLKIVEVSPNASRLQDPTETKSLSQY